MNIGIIPYLKHLAMRFKALAKECSDPKTSFELESFSIELLNKAHDIEQLFAIPVKNHKK
jgi:hypothetical protein